MRVAQAILFVVMLTAANSHRLMKLQDNVDDCYKAAQTLKAAVPEIMDAVTKLDWTTVMSVVMTKVVPEFQPLQAGGLRCYERVAGDYVGQKCITDVVKFAADVQKFSLSHNYLDMMAALQDFPAVMKDCQAKKVALTLTNNVDDCYTVAQTFKAAVPEIMDSVNKQDWMTAMSVVMTKVVPEFQPLEAGRLQCYKKIVADYFGVQKCITDWIKFVEDCNKFRQTNNYQDLLADMTNIMKDCRI